MRLQHLSVYLTAIVAVKAFPNAGRTADCRKINSDPDWPAHEVWKAALPGVEREPRLPNLMSPDYRLRAKSAEDVQNAVKFANKHNIRVSVIATGHDFLGRNTAASGLLIDVSLLNGVNIHESFTPTTEGAKDVAAGQKANVITPKPGVQAAVTVGGGIMGSFLNKALVPSKLFTHGAGHGSVSVVGGWGQLGGHSPLSATYGLGADQFLEAKIVTADGNLVVANSVSNPDLFWAIRGGGGGTFGVVVEATIKAYPDVPVTTVTWFVNSSSPLQSSMDEPLKYLFKQLPDIHGAGIGAYIENFAGVTQALVFHAGENAGVEKANKIWQPILEKMSSFPGIKPYQSKTYHFDSYLPFFQRNFGTMKKTTMMKRHGPGESAGIPTYKGMVPFDSHFLSPEHFKRDDIMSAFSSTSGNYAILMVGPSKKISGNDTSVNPTWRNTLGHITNMRTHGMNTDSIRKYAPEMGAYANEAYYKEPDYQTSFWGSNYAKLSEIKTKYDPNGVFWVTPGINADEFRVLDGRVCRRPVTEKVLHPEIPPDTDNQNQGDWMSRDESRYGRMDLIGEFPAAGTFHGMNVVSP